VRGEGSLPATAELLRSRVRQRPLQLAHAGRLGDEQAQLARIRQHFGSLLALKNTTAPICRDPAASRRAARLAVGKSMSRIPQVKLSVRAVVAATLPATTVR
jgi:hypothetical protein